MAWFVGQSAVMILLAFLLGLLVGWLIWHRRATSESATDEREIIRQTDAPAAEGLDAESVAAVAEPARPCRRARHEFERTRTASRKRSPKRTVTAVAVTPTPTRDHDEPELAPIDDLARVEGIGPKIAAALVEAGSGRYEQLADADLAALHAATKAAKIAFTPSINSWSQQAALLAIGDEDGFKLSPIT